MIFDIRTRIIGKAQEGIWSHDRAEQVAARLGVAPLASEPAPDAFDPMGSPVWTLPMAVVWIAWRDIERVRRSQKSFCSGCWEWRYYESRRPIDGGREWRLVKGWELVQPKPATLSSLSIGEALSESLNHPMLMSVKSAREALWAALGDGQIIASAIGEEAGRPIQVPTYEWPYLDLASGSDLSDSLRFTSSHGRVAYRDLMFSRTDLQRLWPGSESLAAQSHSRSGAPGRPTSMHLVEGQFRQRMANEITKSTNTEEAEILSQWLKENYPIAPQLKPKAIRNRLGSWRREIEAARN